MKDTHIRLTEALHAWLTEEANRRGLSVNTYMSYVLTQHMDQQNEKTSPLTAAQFADALGYFWNASIGEAHRQQEGIATASIMATGFAAVQQRLEEISRDT